MDNREIEMIRSSSLFDHIQDGVFTDVLSSCIIRTIEDGGFYFMQGDTASHAYVLTSGRVKMQQVSSSGTQITLRIITPGETFGGVALLHPEAGYPASAQAAEDSKAAAWETKTLRALVSHDPAISFNVMSLMHGYIMELQHRESALTSERVEKRIARTLLKLASQSGRKVNEGILIGIPLSRQDVAEMTGTTLFTVSRTLKNWEREAILKIGRESVIIRDPHALVRIADDLV